MFPVETLPSQYCEERAAERAAAEVAKRALQSQPQQQTIASKLDSTQSNSMTPFVQARQPVEPTALQKSLMHRPTLSRGTSGGFLGNVLQGFARNAAASTGAKSGPFGPGLVSPAASEKSEGEAMSAEAKRDLDICAMRPW